MRRSLASLVLVVPLLGCGNEAHTPMRSAGAAQEGLGRGDPRSTLAYSHTLSLEMPEATVAPRFERARDRCLDDAALGCTLLSASHELRMYSNPARATLIVRLPHDGVAKFEASLFEPVAGERAGEAAVMSRATSTEELSVLITDAERRMAQLADYRDRLSALAQRPDARIEELMKIASELSTVQSQIEALTAQQKTLAERVRTELMSIVLVSRREPGDAVRPLVELSRQSVALLAESVADAGRFVLRALPWLALLSLALVALGRLRARARRRKLAAIS
jgi:hypothetical protein